MLPISKKDANTAKDATDKINDLEMKLSEAQSSTTRLEHILNEMRKGNRIMQFQQGPGNQAQDYFQNHIEASPSNAEKDLSLLQKLTNTVNDLKNQHYLAQIIAEELKESVNSDLDRLESFEKYKGDKTTECKTRPGDRSSKNKKVDIQLYCAQETALTKFVMQELRTKLLNELGDHGLELKIRIRTKRSRIRRSIPLILICLCSTRLSVDFNNAVSGIPTGSNTAVLMFHHVKQHALPTTPSEPLLLDAEVKNVGMIIDVAFFEGLGMYNCDMNTIAYKTLSTFIKSLL